MLEIQHTIYRHAHFLLLRVDFTLLDVMLAIKTTVESVSNDLTCTILCKWYAVAIKYYSKFRCWNNLTWIETMHTNKKLHYVMLHCVWWHV